MQSVTSFRLNALRDNRRHVGVRLPVSKQQHISVSIERIGLFKTGGIDVELVSISKSGALLNTAHHALLKSLGKDMTIELSLNGKRFEHEAHIIRQDATNNLYGIKFKQSLEVIDDYLFRLNIPFNHALNIPRSNSVWLDLF
ncbi:MAG: PilZ domain-containing protein [Methylococcales bacterium]|nr:PilZ domain-containing protein [Methylococcales bacterium]MDD5754389.1 PilZ domain-containing protein [Methylococcales bacterium]